MKEMRETGEPREIDKGVNRIGVILLLVFMLILSSKAFSASNPPFEITGQNNKILSHQDY